MKEEERQRAILLRLARMRTPPGARGDLLPVRLPRARRGAWVRISRAATSWNSSDRRAAGRPRSPSSASRTCRRTVSPPRGSMPTTPSTRPTRRDWAWTWSGCPSPSPIGGAGAGNRACRWRVGRGRSGGGGFGRGAGSPAGTGDRHRQRRSRAAQPRAGVGPAKIASRLLKSGRMRGVSQPDAQPAGSFGGRGRDQRRRRAAQAFRRRAHRDAAVARDPGWCCEY